MSYILGNRSFKTKSAIIDHAKHIKDTRPIGQDLIGDDLDFMYSLLGWHSEFAIKVGVGIQSITIRPNPSFGQREFYLWRIDGSGTDFSYKQCVNPSTPEANFRAACRNEISQDIMTFVRSNYPQGMRCPITGQRLTASEFHVDHAPPNTFAHLVYQWLTVNRYDWTAITIAGRGVDNCYRLQFADGYLRTDWRVFHHDHAHLRLVSKDANLRIIGTEWEGILNWLRETQHDEAVIEWKGKRWYYCYPDDTVDGVLMLPESAPDNMPILDGAIALIEMSLS